jgi:hypothetical protein
MESLLEDFRKEYSRKVDLVIYVPIYERILCLICGFFEKPTPPAFKFCSFVKLLSSIPVIKVKDLLRESSDL